jgi:hypothetical protein
LTTKHKKSRRKQQEQQSKSQLKPLIEHQKQEIKDNKNKCKNNYKHSLTTKHKKSRRKQQEQQSKT